MKTKIPTIIAVAPNGARKTKADHPTLPITANEMAATALACRQAGASMLHLHVRDAKGQHSLDADLYKVAIRTVRQTCGSELIIQMTTEAVGRYTPKEQMASVRSVKPEAVSLAIKELVPENVSGAEAEAARFFSELYESNIMLQYILYSPEDLRRFRALVQKGVVPGEQHSVLFVLGRYAEGGSSLSDLAPFLAESTKNLIWMVCAFGPMEAAIMKQAISAGGHCRVGFENNQMLTSAKVAPDNAALVSLCAESAKEFGRLPTDASCARKMFGDN